ncbi:NUDIX hydrolase [Natronomonas sp. F2-12]|jgi:ADP-ribose pyrophosphatase|uniref:NUDIX hydrolase n=1 Tax=Natronomonas aquatica TaxID=2841590 RepID=A0A9R1D562_9EURY|nr:NUDIX hydrolase [Natronomonas aquatica]MCQ4332741.1 NUDIX hydrolase [Natronomonas aquatica]
MAFDDLAWRTLGSEIDYTCPGFDVVRDDVRLPDGTETEFHYVSEPPSVVVLPFTEDGDVVVIREWRQAVERVNFGLPAGGLEDEDADVSAAARRELREETGYEAGDVERVGTYEPANGLFDSVLHYVLAHGCEPTASQELDHNESIAVETRTFEELRSKALDGDLRDGRSALAVLQYAVRSDE